MRRQETKRQQKTTEELDAVVIDQLIAEEREPRPTQLMPRDELLGLIDATTQPVAPLHAHTVPREKKPRRLLPSKRRVSRGMGSVAMPPLEQVAGYFSTQSPFEEPLDFDSNIKPSISPLLVLAVLAVFVGLFLAVIQLK